MALQVAPLRIAAQLVNDAASAGELGVRQLRFPGWRAWLDGQPIAVGVSPFIPEQQARLGFMTVPVPPGEHTITLAFGTTPLRLAGMAVSLFSAVAVAWAARQTTRSLAAGRAWVFALRWAALVPALGLVALGWQEVRSMMPEPRDLTLRAPRVVDGIWQAPGITHTTGGLVVNVAEAVRTAQARVESPMGASVGQGAFVDVRHLTVGNQADTQLGVAGTTRRQWLFLHPPSSVSIEVALPAHKEVWFHAVLAIDPDVWSAPTGDGVRLWAEITPRSGPAGAGLRREPVVVAERILNPRARIEDRRWVPVAVDLSAWAGSTINLRLAADPRDDVSYDWSGWGDPVIVARESARAYPGAGTG